MKSKENYEGLCKCQNCKVKNNYKDIVTERIDYIVCEKERVCNICGWLMDYWAYGYWESLSE